MKTSNPTKQGKSKVGYKQPPIETRFGGKKANPRHNGAWRKQDTARYKLERMMEMSKGQLQEVIDDEERPLFEQKLATAIKQGRWREIESMINQVYGQPKQTVDAKVEQVTPLVDIDKLKED